MEGFTLEELGAWGTGSLHSDPGCSWRNSNCKHIGRSLETENRESRHPPPDAHVPGGPVRNHSPLTKLGRDSADHSD